MPPSSAKVDSKAESRSRFKKAKRESAVNGGADGAAKRRSENSSSKRLSTVTVGDGDATIASSNSGGGTVKADSNGFSSSDTVSSKTNLVPLDIGATSEMFGY